jgi:hypothetical protein
MAVVIIIGLLAPVLPERLSRYRSTQKNRHGNHCQKRAHRIAAARRQSDDAGQNDGSDNLLNENHVAWLETIPPNYISGLKSPKRTDVASGELVF